MRGVIQQREFNFPGKEMVGMGGGHPTAKFFKASTTKTGSTIHIVKRDGRI